MAEDWSVVAQVQAQGIGLNGRLEDRWDVTYRTATGIVGTVKVPVADYNPDRVRELIEADVAKHAAIRAL